MFELEHITKTFKSDLLRQPFTALDDVSFSLDENQIIGYLGANGAGKTTSLKIILNFIRPTSGKVNFSKQLGHSPSEIFRNIGFLPERPYFYAHLTGREFCFFMGELTEQSRDRIKSQIEFWAPRFKIDFALDREIKTYSKGMLQRIGFLVTILHDPKLIILDEPLSGIDPVGRKELKDIMVEIHKMGKTIFFSSHIVSDVEEVCESVVFLKSGKLIYNGSVDHLISENMKDSIRVRYKTGSEIKSEIITEKDKANFLKKSLENNYNIISLEQEKPTLEEIFYNIKS